MESSAIRSAAQVRAWRLGWVKPYLWILPAVALFAVFRLYPMAFGLYLSFQQWDGVKPMAFVGLANFRQAVLEDATFHLALWHNVVYAVGTVVGKNAVALVLAVLLNGQIRGRAFFRTTLFMPVVMSFVVVGLLWSWIFNFQFGLLNSLLVAAGLGDWRVDWLGNPSVALYALIGVDVWKWYGFHMVIYLAGLQTIPPSLYEAAMIDGASVWQQLRRITLPLIRPIMVVNVTLALMGAFNVFDLIYVMTQGGPANATNVVMIHAYLQGFKFYNMGYAAAISYVLMAIVTVLSALQIRLMRSERYEY
ncbi:MAG TPA: sugar ABC transporter permease [Chloroflexota bacterium]|nr:sugar ABC transporter permease [Chloroflexota bacterium]